MLHFISYKGRLSDEISVSCRKKNVPDRHWLMSQACDWWLWTDQPLTDEISNTDHLAHSAGKKNVDPGSHVAASPKHGCLHLVLSLLHLSPNISNELMDSSEADSSQARDGLHTRRVRITTRFIGSAPFSASLRCLYFGEMGHEKIKYARMCEETLRHSVKWELRHFYLKRWI